MKILTFGIALFGFSLFAQQENLVLFSFDDHSLPFRDNLKITLQQPKRYGKGPVMIHSDGANSIDGYGTALYGTVLHENGKFRMWYLAWPHRSDDPKYNTPEERPDFYRPIGYAESTDGIHWTKPNLGLVEFRGSKNNNAVLIEPTDHPYSRPVDFNAVLYDPKDPDPSRRYKMAYIVFDLKRRFSPVVNAVSADGLRWKLVNTEPYTRGHFENTALVRFKDEYYTSGQNIYPFGGNLADGTPAGRVMTVLRSPDFKKWSPDRVIAFHRDIYESAPEALGEEVHMGAGLWNRGNVILGLYGMWHGPMIKPTKTTRLAGLTIDLGFVISNDAMHYREPVRRFKMVPRGAPGEWDSQCLLQANAYYNSDTETYIWYSHWDLDNQFDAIKEKKSSPRQAIGLLKLPRDRFGYLSKLLIGEATGAGKKLVYDQGSVVSKQVQFSRTAKLFVNADGVTDAAPLKIEILDKMDNVIRQANVTKDSLKGLVSWNAGQALPLNQPFRIKVTWPTGTADPHLYAVYVEH